MKDAVSEAMGRRLWFYPLLAGFSADRSVPEEEAWLGVLQARAGEGCFALP